MTSFNIEANASTVWCDEKNLCVCLYDGRLLESFKQSQSGEFYHP